MTASRTSAWSVLGVVIGVAAVAGGLWWMQNRSEASPSAGTVSTAPAAAQIELGALERPSTLPGRSDAIVALSDGAAVKTFGPDQQVGLAMVGEDGKPRWTRRLPCATGDTSNVTMVATGDDAVAVRCRLEARPKLVTMVLAADGTLRWAGGETVVSSRLRPSSIDAFGRDATIVEHHRFGLLQALDASDGTTLWSRQDVSDVHLFGDALWADGMVLARRDGAQRAEAPGRTAGTTPDGICVRRDGDPRLVQPDGTSRALLSADDVSAMAAEGMDVTQAGWWLRCGVHGDRTVLLANANRSLLWVTQEGDAPRVVGLPVSAGSPGVRGWERPLPRFVPIITRDELIVVDLEEVRVAWTLNVATADARAFGEIPAVRARSGDRFMLSIDNELLAIDGRDGTFLASESAVDNTGFWFTLDQAIAGDRVWVPLEGGGVRPVPLLTPEQGDRAARWTAKIQRKDERP